MTTKEKIFDILFRYSYNVQSIGGDNLIVVDEDNWDKVAEAIMALDSPTYGTKYTIRKGDKFLCLKDYVMNDDSIAYIKGRTYLADQDDCIQDEIDETDHVMANQEDFFVHFKPLQ